MTSNQIEYLNIEINSILNYYGVDNPRDRQKAIEEINDALNYVMSDSFKEK